MYTATINSTFSNDENGNIELELLYKDSDGQDIGAYAAGDDIASVLNDIADQIEEALTAAEKEEDEEMDEITRLNKKIEELSKQVEDLTARNAELVNAHNSTDNRKEDYSYLLDKLNNFKSAWGDDFAPLFKHVIA